VDDQFSILIYVFYRFLLADGGFASDKKTPPDGKGSVFRAEKCNLLFFMFAVAERLVGRFSTAA
jgi:hypothetical protein